MIWLVATLLIFMAFIRWMEAHPRKPVRAAQDIPEAIEFLLAQGSYVGAKCMLCLSSREQRFLTFRKYVDTFGPGCTLTVEESRWGKDVVDQMDAEAKAHKLAVRISYNWRGQSSAEIDCKDDIGVANSLARYFFIQCIGVEPVGNVVIKLRSVLFENNERLTRVRVVERGKLPRRRSWTDRAQHNKNSRP